MIRPQVALQFPDELLVDSVAVGQQIEGKTQSLTYILADTSYGRYRARGHSPFKGARSSEVRGASFHFVCFPFG